MTNQNRPCTLRPADLPPIDGTPWVTCLAGIDCHGGWEGVCGLANAALPGLVVHAGRTAGVCITHVSSGHRLAYLSSLTARRRRVMGRVFALLGAGGDWTLTADEIAADGTVCERMAGACDEARHLVGDAPLSQPLAVKETALGRPEYRRAS